MNNKLVNNIFLLLGSNLGNRLSQLQLAIEELNQHIFIVNRSSIYESEPWGVNEQPWFLNAVLEIATNLSPEELLNTCQEIENKMGRKRIKRWGERVIDIDILYYNHEVIEKSHLIIPHIGIPTRKFTLMPLAEIAPNFIHPISNKTSLELLSDCDDVLDCKKSNLIW